MAPRQRAVNHAVMLRDVRRLFRRVPLTDPLAAMWILPDGYCVGGSSEHWEVGEAVVLHYPEVELDAYTKKAQGALYHTLKVYAAMFRTGAIRNSSGYATQDRALTVGLDLAHEPTPQQISVIQAMLRGADELAIDVNYIPKRELDVCLVDTLVQEYRPSLGRALAWIRDTVAQGAPVGCESDW